MTETPAPTPETAPRKASRTRTILMMIFGGIVLALGGCALFLSYASFGTSSSNDTVAGIGAIGFVGGALAFVGGVLWALARWIDRRFSKAAGT
jgi:hypothetical protein